MNFRHNSNFPITLILWYEFRAAKIYVNFRIYIIINIQSKLHITVDTVIEISN